MGGDLAWLRNASLPALSPAQLEALSRHTAAHKLANILRSSYFKKGHGRVPLARIVDDLRQGALASKVAKNSHTSLRALLKQEGVERVGLLCRSLSSWC